MKSMYYKISEIHFKAVRSSGPGGQNVNKVSSCAQMYWHFQYAELITEEQKQQISLKLANHINKDGALFLRSDEFRDLERNKTKCLEKLNLLLKKAFFRPKLRKKTKPTYSSQLKRLDGKKSRSEIKKNRQKIT